MLIRNATLELIKSGAVSVAYRRWKRPTVKAGGTLKTRIGLLAIDRVEETSLKHVTAGDAHNAGYESKQALLAELQGREGTLYKISLHYLGDDPRLQLRENDHLCETELADMKRRLERMDSRAACGPWTFTVLELIEAHPETLAKVLADEFGMEKMPFKTNVRKLKNLGLTISHKIGYSLSPRGIAVLNYLRT